MIASLILQLKKMERIKQYVYPSYVHGFIYDSIRHTTIGQAYHDSSVTPFAIKNISPNEFGDLFIQITIFDYSLLLELYRSLPINKTIYLGKIRYRLTLAAIHPEEHPMAEIVSYKYFLNQPIEDNIKIHFHNTVFNHSKTKQLILFPIPLSIVHSLFRKWNATSLQKIDIENEDDFIKELSMGLNIFNHHIYTEPYKVSPTLTLNSFSGTAIFSNTHTNPELKRILNQLLLFAHYSGIGWKVAYGMGSIDVTPISVTRKRSVIKKGEKNVSELKNHISH